jgi:hypothetical protein
VNVSTIGSSPPVIFAYEVGLVLPGADEVA